MTTDTTKPTLVGAHFETIAWRYADIDPPDDDITVLCWLEPMGEWFAGWRDGRQWHDAATGGRLEGVRYWADIFGPYRGP